MNKNNIIPETPISNQQQRRTIIPETPISNQPKRTIIPETPMSNQQQHRTIIPETPMSNQQQRRTIIPETPMSNLPKRRIVPETPMSNLPKRRIVPETPMSNLPKKRIVPETPLLYEENTNNIVRKYGKDKLKKVCNKLASNNNKFKTPTQPHAPSIIPETPENNIEEFPNNNTNKIKRKMQVKKKLYFPSNEEINANTYLQNSNTKKTAFEKALNIIIQKRKNLENLSNKITNINQQNIINKAYVPNSQLIQQYCDANNATKNSFTMSPQERQQLEKKCADAILAKRFYTTIQNAEKEEQRLQNIYNRLQYLQSKINQQNTIGTRRPRNNHNNRVPKRSRINQTNQIF